MGILQTIGAYINDAITSITTTWSSTKIASEISAAACGFLTSTITPPIINANTNNYSPTGLAPGNFIRLSASLSVDITGINSSGFSDRDTIAISNVGMENIKFKRLDPLSSANNQFAIKSDIQIDPDESVLFIFDGNSNKWRAVADYT